jgi:alanyl-tRNA synthetase
MGAPTEKLYLADTYAFSTDAKVIRVLEDGDTTLGVVLDRTVFHPQGGGQPSDTGECCI